MKLDIATHVFAGKMDQYWQALCVHLSAASLARREFLAGNFWVVVCTCDRRRYDPKTFAVLDYFRKHHQGDQWIEQFRLPLGELFRRSIGRNLVAKTTTADAVIFTDVDYIWTTDALSALIHCYDSSHPISFARHVTMHDDPVDGDTWLRKIKQPGFVSPWTDEVAAGGLFLHREIRGIGGNQIVSGDYCRTRGYLGDHEKFQTPTTEITIPFSNFRDDATFRRQAGATLGISGYKPSGRKREYYGNPLPLPGVFRIRHSDAPYRRTETLANNPLASIIDGEQLNREAAE